MRVTTIFAVAIAAIATFSGSAEAIPAARRMDVNLCESLAPNSEAASWCKMLR